MNKLDPKQLLHEILDIIHYEEDKETYINEFLSLCYQNAFTKLVMQLPQEAQDEVKGKLSDKTTDEELMQLLAPYISEENLQVALKSGFEELFAEFFKEVVPTLSSLQKRKLQVLLITERRAVEKAKK